MSGQNSFVITAIVSCPATTGGLLAYQALVSDITRLLSEFKSRSRAHEYNSQLGSQQVIQGSEQ